MQSRRISNIEQKNIECRSKHVGISQSEIRPLLRGEQRGVLAGTLREIGLLILILLLSSFATAQETDDLSTATREYIENVVADTDEEFDYDEVYTLLQTYRQKPMDLNEVTDVELSELRLLTSIQISSFLNYRNDLGDLIDIRELQSVPNFDIETISRILPYVGVKKDRETFNVPLGAMLYKGSNELYIRYQRRLELSRGLSPPTAEDTSRYLGNPGRIYARFRHQYENRHSWGITMEKDPGEEFFTGSNKQGFDFYSAHLYFRNLSKTVKSVALGDYYVNLGQGLVMSSGFGSGKSSYIASIRRGGRKIIPYTSVNEAVYFRGAAGTFGLGNNLFVTAFGSYRNRDANVILMDTLDIEDVNTFSSLQESGLHRRANEIEDENAITQINGGGSLQYKTRRFQLGLNGVYTKFDAMFDRNKQVYSQFQFSGDQSINASMDYGLLLRNINFFGEFAISQSGGDTSLVNGGRTGFAMLNGMLIGLDKTVDLAILHRSYQKEYNSFYGNPFGETSQGNNENGLYIGLSVKPNYNWAFSAYMDTWRHPWLRFQADGPSTGYDYLLKVNYRVKRKMEAYVRFRHESKQRNAPNNETAINYLIDQRRSDIRLHVANKVSKFLELRNRVDLMFFNNQIEPVSRGFMVYQDVIFKPMAPWSFTTRFAIFETDDYDSRTYAYENDLLGSAFVPAYAYKGTRFYFNLRYKGIRNMTLEARFAQTYLRDFDVFGSGLEEIEGHTRTEVKVQMKYKF